MNLFFIKEVNCMRNRKRKEYTIVEDRGVDKKKNNKET